MKLHLLLAISSVLLLSVRGSTDTDLPNEAPANRTFWGDNKDLHDYLKDIGYDKKWRPGVSPGGVTEGPVVVEISMFIISINSISEVTMDYHLELMYRERWLDARLDWNTVYFKDQPEIVLHESYLPLLWLPDTFFPNARKSINPDEMSVTHRALIRLLKGGGVLYSRKLSISAECPMNLRMFPFDKQICKLGIESYGYPNTEITYKWSKPGGESVKFESTMLPDFNLDRHLTTSTVVTFTTGNYTRLYLCFLLSRSWSFALPQLVLPASSAVLVSWVSLWMEEETSFQDLITILLTITLLIFSYNSTMPRVSYIKALDVFLGVSSMFVVFALGRLVLVKYIKKKLAQHTAAKTAQQEPRVVKNKNDETEQMLEMTYKGNTNGPEAVENHQKEGKVFGCVTQPMLDKFDSVCQIAFPMSFVMFCIAYFVRYMYFTERVLDPDCIS